ncbi:MAG: hypothetical protein KY455_02075 [Euryarchaeota archaeon]|nr:hypothetical protein [Euryarchaeota archaeon]
MIGLLVVAFISPVVHAQNQIPEFQIDATLGNTDFELIPGIYHKVQVTTDIICKTWSPIMQVSPMNFDHEISFEGVPEDWEVFLEIDDPSVAIVFTPSDCIEATAKTYGFNVTIQPDETLDAFVPLTFKLSVIAKRGSGEDRETWEMRIGFGGDVYFTPRSPYEVTDPSGDEIRISIGNWGNTEIAGWLQMNESRSGEITMDRFDFGPIPHRSTESATSWGVPIRFSDIAISHPGLYPLVVDAFAYPVAEPNYPIPMQMLELIIDTRPIGEEASEVNVSSDFLAFSVIVLIGLLALWWFRRQ